MSDALPKLVFVTGPSGAGRSTALNALEDLGFETIDNLPILMIERLLMTPLTKPLALGVDVRNRDFSPATFDALLDALAERTDFESHLVFLDARLDVLERRFSETRRPHPLAQDSTPKSGLMREFDLVAGARDRAEIVIETSDLTPHDLRAKLTEWIADPKAARMALTLISFSYKRGLPSAADLVMDCRFLRNPHWEPDLRQCTGKDQAVQDYVTADEGFDIFRDRTLALLEHLLPAYRREGKAHLGIGFGCTGGQHRSVTVTEIVAKDLANKGWQVSIDHRELGRRV